MVNPFLVVLISRFIVIFSPHMVMGMQSVFVVGGDNLPVLPDAYANVYLKGGNFTPWSASEIATINNLKGASYWEIDD
jgi:hypothetical protein